MATIPRRKGDFNEQLVPLRDSLWPEVDKSRLWTHKQKGWAYVPKSLPIVLVAMDRLSVGKPVSSVYFDLWCRTRNDSFVIANHQHEMAFSSGFTGERAARTWRDRIDILRDIGFIDTKSGPTGEVSYILLLSPFEVIASLRQRKKVNDNVFNSLLARLVELRSDDAKILQADETRR